MQKIATTTATMGWRRSLLLTACAFLSVLHPSLCNAQQSNDACETLYLLNIVPFPDSTPGAGWDEGFELIPAGRVAIDQINNRSDLLPGFKLELVNVPSEGCSRRIITEAIEQYFNHSYYQNYSRCIIGVVGLFCSTTTDVISSIANHPAAGYVQLTSSGSPLHRDTARLPHTFSTISSSKVYNKAMIALMRQFAWRKINVVRGTVNFYQRTTLDDFVKLANSKLSELHTVENRVIEIDPKRPFSELLDRIKAEERRIGYFSIDNEEVAKLMCEVYRNKFFSPRYTFIFDHRSLKKVYAALEDRNITCTEEEIMEALEGAIFMRYRQEAFSNNTLISGLSFDEYRDRYTEELQKFQNEPLVMSYNISLTGKTPFANVMHDQVWAMALAANKSLSIFLNHSIAINASAEIRKKLTEELKKIEFYGASGFIRYGEEQEVQSLVDINQLRNGSEVKIATYDNNYNGTLTRYDNKTMPNDTFETRRQLIHLGLGTTVIICDGLLAIVIAFNAFAIIFLRKKPEIKSSSFLLSSVIMLGCSLLLFPPVINTVQLMFDMDVLPVLCSFNTWLLINGTNIILVTLLVRLFRIFHVFRSYHSTGKYWSDKYLLLYSFLLCSPTLLLMVVQSAMDPFTLKTERRFISSANNPYIEIHQTCSSNFYNLWLGLSFGYIGLVMMFSIFFAIQTRHIKRKHFKDTKKVNMFIFGTCIIYAICIPMWFILLAVGLDTLAFACESVAPLAGAALCQVFLFLPKTMPAITSPSRPNRSSRSSFIASTSDYNYMTRVSFIRRNSESMMVSRPSFMHYNSDTMRSPTKHESQATQMWKRGSQNSLMHKGSSQASLMWKGGSQTNLIQNRDSITSLRMNRDSVMSLRMKRDSTSSFPFKPRNSAISEV